MIWKQALLGLVGFAGGISVAGGVFAFISILEMLPRLASRLHMANRVYHLENCIFWGGLTGAVLTVFEISVPFGSAMLAVFGLFTVKVFDGNDKVLCEEILNIPTMIYMYPADIIEDEVSLESDIGDGGDRYIILRFFTGDIFTPVNIIQNLDNTELFLNLL